MSAMGPNEMNIIFPNQHIFLTTDLNESQPNFTAFYNRLKMQMLMFLLIYSQGKQKECLPTGKGQVDTCPRVNLVSCVLITVKANDNIV